MAVPRRILALVFSIATASLLRAAEGEPAPPVALRTPQLLTMQPMSGRPGGKTTVEIRGEFLDRAERVVFSHPDVSAVIQQAGFSRVRLEVEVREGAEPGARYFRLITPRGASNLLLFRVSEWPSVLEAEPNNEPDRRQWRNLARFDWPALISGMLNTPRDVDLFRFQAKAGETIFLSLLAARNWSGADLSLTVLDLAGHAIAQDEGRLIWDPHIRFTCPKDGDYIAAVTLTRMPAGGQSRTDLAYQLAIGPAPFLLSAFPLYPRGEGNSLSLEVRGEFPGLHTERMAWGIQGGALEVKEVVKGVSPSSGDSRVATLRLAGRIESFAATEEPEAHFLYPKDPSGWVAPLAVLAGEFSTLSESAKNDSLAGAQPISLPVTVNGRIESDWDDDYYRFEAAAGDALAFVIDAEKWGSPLDARLTLFDAKGKALANNDDAKVIARGINWDPKIEHTFKEGGTFYIRVYSLQRRGGPDYVYALTARRQSPTFTLGLGAERVAVRRGDKANWNVTVQREEGFKDEVVVEVSGLPAGVTAQPLRLKPDQNSGSIAIVAADAPVWAGRVEVTGKASTQGREIVRRAYSPSARITGRGPGFSQERPSEAWLSVVDAPAFSLESAVSEVFLARGSSAEFGVKVVRRPAAAGELEFSLENLPQGVTLANVEMVDQGRMARLTLRASDSAAVGRVPDVTIVGALPGPMPQQQAAPRINLQVD